MMGREDKGMQGCFSGGVTLDQSNYRPRELHSVDGVNKKEEKGNQLRQIKVEGKKEEKEERERREIWQNSSIVCCLWVWYIGTLAAIVRLRQCCDSISGVQTNRTNGLASSLTIQC